ncbi:MAG: hypothetical protein DRJ01_13690 [Bacteroidetes bacterium]|nr:MAG: hypothetical protein DRJ01_13690 [Bacteroidota bacterium]
MKKIFKFIYFVLFIPLVSCIEEIDMTHYEHEDKIVVNSLFSPDSNFYVRISKSTGLNEAVYGHSQDFSGDDSIRLDFDKWYIKPVRVKDANVELWKNDKFLEKLLYTRLGVFRSVNEIPEPNQKYEVRVSASGLESVTADDMLPQKVNIISANFEDAGFCFDNYGYFVKITITFKDPADDKNYYEILLPDTTWYDDFNDGNLIDSVGYYVYYNQLRTDDPVVLAEGEQDFICRSFVFSDDMINGQIYEATIYLFIGSDVEGTVDYTGFSQAIELRTVSRKYYLYRKKMRKYLNYKFSGTDLEQIYTIGDPVIMYTNVENGYGVFVGYSADTVILTEKDQVNPLYSCKNEVNCMN